MIVLLAFPILFILLLIQTTLLSQLTLLSGSADLILLWLVAWSLQTQVKNKWIWVLMAAAGAAFVTALPWYVPLITYFAAAWLAKTANRRFWQSPILMMFLVTIITSLFGNLLTWVALSLTGTSIELQTGLIYVIIPSMLLNLLLALPVYVVAKDTGQWMYQAKGNE